MDTASRKVQILLNLLKPESYVNFLDFLVGCFLVFGPLGFIGALDQISIVFLAFGVLLYSSIYIFNDILDRRYDRKHPIKKERPLAAGEISPKYALILAFAMSGAGLLVGLYVSAVVCWFELGFLALNIAYTTVFKKIPYLDLVGSTITHPVRVIFAIVLFGQLEITHIPIIMAVGLYWLTYNGLKRHQELADVGEKVRPSLQGYSLRELALGSIGSTATMIPLFGLLHSPKEYLILAGYLVIAASLLVGYFRGTPQHKRIVHFMLKN